VRARSVRLFDGQAVQEFERRSEKKIPVLGGDALGIEPDWAWPAR
jgi:hypothetical protein